MPKDFTVIEADYIQTSTGLVKIVSELGEQGPPGPMGPEGPAGSPGPAGADSTVVGPAGPRGLPGADGAAGSKGDKGDTGDAGPQGLQGLRGEPGPTGTDGAAGPQGLPGNNGEQGPQGIQGPPGVDSTVPGPQGPSGNDGAQGAQGIPGVQGEVGPQGPAGPSTPFILPLNAYTAAASTWTNMPSATTFLFGSHRHITKADLTGYTQCRFIVNKQATAGAAAAKLILRYRTAFSVTVTDYLDIGISEISLAVNVQNSVLVTAWIDLVAGARADVFVAVVGSGGDGVLDPAFGMIIAQFK